MRGSRKRNSFHGRLTPLATDTAPPALLETMKWDEGKDMIRVDKIVVGTFRIIIE